MENHCLYLALGDEFFDTIQINFNLRRLTILSIDLFFNQSVLYTETDAEIQPSKYKIQQNLNSLKYSNSSCYFIPKQSTSHDALPSCILHLPEGRARLVSENPEE